ncbi:MAG: hypothetical protein O4965_08820 [Trichodesmium sp. St19_bin1]|nr:hypothetical protein [Trichodesmium sp. St19_bin1]
MSSPSLIPHLHRANIFGYAKRGDREPLNIVTPNLNTDKCWPADISELKP